jgi:hypothetical protein
VHAHNSFDTPDAVQPNTAPVNGSSFTFPAASVSKFEITLA